MALCPFARIRLIPAGSNDPRITAIGAVLHVDAGNAESLYAYFNGPSGGIESHFHIQKDGGIEQYRDTAYEADANYQGNSFTKNGKLCGLISIETQGYGSGEWTSAQLASIKRLLTWLSETHNFPLRKIPAWNGSGVGYHVMWGAPGPWTPVSKSCPGPDRIKQYNNIIVPWMNGEPQEDDMPLDADDKDWIRDALKNERDNIARAVQERTVQVGNTREPMGLAVGRTRVQVKNMRADQLSGDLVDLKTLAAEIVAALPDGQPIDVAVVEQGVRNALGSLDE